MKFLFIYPPPESFFIKTSQNFYGLSPPLGLLYIAKILEEIGDSVKIVDFSAEPFNEHMLNSAIRNVDAIGITVLSPSLINVKNLINVIKQNKPDTPVIIGGPHCSLLPKESLQETQADICVQGDGETVITDIKQALNSTKDFSKIPGVIYQTVTGIKQGPFQQPIRDLNKLPFPARHLIKHYIYGRQYNPQFKAGEFTSIITSRGCPYNCHFCSRGAINMQRYRKRSTHNIIAELQEIKRQRYQHVLFADDCFPVNMKQTHDLFDAIIQEDFNLKFSITASRVDLVDQELYKKMRKAGVTHIQFGLESGNQDVLDFYHKQTTLDTIKKTVWNSHNAGFFTIGSFIFGAPFETEKHFNNTLLFAKSLPLDSVSFLPLRYMIGSELWNEAVSDGKISEKEYLAIADKTKGLGVYTKEELIRYCLNAQRSFYGRPTFFIDLLKKSLRNNDMTYIQSYLSIFFSSIRNTFVKKKNDVVFSKY